MAADDADVCAEETLAAIVEADVAAEDALVAADVALVAAAV